jgi:CRP-like cAMP-binding protein
LKVEILACHPPCQAGAQHNSGNCHSLDHCRKFCHSRIAGAGLYWTPRSLFLFHYLRRAEGGSYGESSKERVQSQSVSCQGRNPENDIEIPQGSSHFRQGDIADTTFYIQKGRVQIVVVSDQGKEAVVAVLEPDQFFSEGCLNGQSIRIATATAMEECLITSITKTAMMTVLESEPKFSRMFMAYPLTRNSRVEEDLIDQLGPSRKSGASEGRAVTRDAEALKAKIVCRLYDNAMRRAAIEGIAESRRRQVPV